MFRLKIFISIFVFSFLLFGTSIIKNQTREIEKQIIDITKSISIKKKDFYESQLDYSYLTSPSIIEKKIGIFENDQYFPMEYSKIFSSMTNFLDLQNKFVIKKNQDEKKIQKK